jgi:hypothetical protein
MNGFYEQNLSYLQSNDVTEMLGYDSRPFPSSCSSNNTDVELSEKGVKQLSSSPLYVNARGGYLNVCRTFRQEFLRLENFEETLFSNIMKGTVNETHLTTLQMQFEVCSRLFNQQREKKVVLVELISQNLQRKSSNDICGNNNYFMKELASEKAARKLIGDKKRIEQAEDTIDYNVSLSSMTDKHSSVQHLKSISIRHSCGRTRQDLNRLRLGHGHGMFATFGNEQFWYAPGTFYCINRVLKHLDAYFTSLFCNCYLYCSHAMAQFSNEKWLHPNISSYFRQLFIRTLASLD